MDAVEQLVVEELRERTPQEIVSAYRSFCASILIRAAQVARAKTPPRKVEVRQKRTAAEWVQGGQGLLTFESACEAVGLQPDLARRAIHAYAGDGGAISRVAKRSRHTYSRKNYGTSDCTAVAQGQAEPCVGVAPCDPAAAADCCG